MLNKIPRRRNSDQKMCSWTRYRISSSALTTIENFAFQCTNWIQYEIENTNNWRKARRKKWNSKKFLSLMHFIKFWKLLREWFCWKIIFYVILRHTLLKIKCSRARREDEFNKLASTVRREKLFLITRILFFPSQKNVGVKIHKSIGFTSIKFFFFFLFFLNSLLRSNEKNLLILLFFFILTSTRQSNLPHTA